MSQIIDFQDKQYLDLETVKQWLHIDQEFEDDDLLLYGLIDVAQAIVEKQLDTYLEDIEQDGKLPSPILQAMLFWIASAYDQRDSIASGQITEVPQTMELMINLYKNYLADNAINRNSSN